MCGDGAHAVEDGEGTVNGGTLLVLLNNLKAFTKKWSVRGVLCSVGEEGKLFKCLILSFDLFVCFFYFCADYYNFGKPVSLFFFFPEGQKGLK